MKYLLCLFLAGCSTPRFFTDAEDEEARKNCQAGCLVVPVPIMKQLLDRIGVAI